MHVVVRVVRCGALRAWLRLLAFRAPGAAARKEGLSVGGCPVWPIRLRRMSASESAWKSSVTSRLSPSRHARWNGVFPLSSTAAI